MRRSKVIGIKLGIAKPDQILWFLGWIGIVGFCFYFYWRNKANFGLDVFDETLYLKNGLSGVIDPSWSPLYSLWYSFWGRFQTDPMRLYDLNALLVSGLLVPSVVYAMTARVTSSFVGALWASIIVISSYGNFPIDRKLHLLNACFLLILTFFVRGKTLKSQFFFYLGLSISLYLREENIAYLCMFACYDIYSAIRAGSVYGGRSRIKLLSVVLSVLVAVLLHIGIACFIGSPYFSNSRAWSALQDYSSVSGYSLGSTKFLQSEGKSREPEPRKEGGLGYLSLSLIYKNIGPFCNNVFKFVQALPSFLSIKSVFDDTSWVPREIREFLTLALLFLVLLLTGDPPGFGRQVEKASKREESNPLFLMMAFSFGRAMLLCVLLVSVPKYAIELIFCTFIALVALTIELRRRLKCGFLSYKVGILLLVIIGLVQVGTHSSTYTYLSTARQFISSLAKLRDLYSGRAFGGEELFYAGYGRDRIYKPGRLESGISIAEFLNSNKIDIVVTTCLMPKKYEALGRLNDLLRFESNPERFGFSLYYVGTAQFTGSLHTFDYAKIFVRTKSNTSSLSLTDRLGK